MSESGLFVPSGALWFIGGVLYGGMLATGIVLTAGGFEVGPLFIGLAVIVPVGSLLGWGRSS